MLCPVYAACVAVVGSHPGRVCGKVLTLPSGRLWHLQLVPDFLGGGVTVAVVGFGLHVQLGVLADGQQRVQTVHFTVRLGW